MQHTCAADAVGVVGSRTRKIIVDYCCQPTNVKSACCYVCCHQYLCCRVLQCVAVCCSVLQCVAARRVRVPLRLLLPTSVLQYLASVLQCVAVCCSVLQCVAVCCSEGVQCQHTAAHCSALQHTATHCNTLQHIATHCNTLQHTATHCNIDLGVPTHKQKHTDVGFQCRHTYAHTHT